MQNREELRKKGHDGSQKMTCCDRGGKISFSEGEVELISFSDPCLLVALYELSAFTYNQTSFIKRTDYSLGILYFTFSQT
jgi:hypothetical protein